jgi:hypothetical protein
MTKMNKFFGHLRTVNKHRREVRKLCFKCGLYWQGLTHDLSKYSPIEFINGVRFFTGTKSPHSGEREKYGYSKAWLHHKAHNKHHREYWQDRHGDKVVAIDMPRKYFVEMICDRVAACKIYLKENYTNDAPWNYYDSHRDDNQFSTNTRQDLVYFLQMLRDEGEEYLFEYLRYWVKI